MIPNVTILGDSRVFDTYYVNAKYVERYGYDCTFPHLWRKRVLTDREAGYDVVHIPDHFRGRTVQNNIVRLALTDPAIVVIVDGIWETLINKGHFLDYAKRRLKGYDGRSGEELALTYSPRRVVELFKAGELRVSPQALAERTRTLVSYFRRRRRQAIVITVPVPPKAFVGSNYHAGDFRPIPGWDECLAAVDRATRAAVAPYGATVIDLTALMQEMGGPEAAFIDQWHFSRAFHARLAEILDVEARRLLPHAAGTDHVSHAYMLGPVPAEPRAEVVLHEGGAAEEPAALKALGPEQILVYAREVENLENPRGDDRAEFETQADR